MSRSPTPSALPATVLTMKFFRYIDALAWLHALRWWPKAAGSRRSPTAIFPTAEASHGCSPSVMAVPHTITRAEAPARTLHTTATAGHLLCNNRGQTGRLMVQKIPNGRKYRRCLCSTSPQPVHATREQAPLGCRRADNLCSRGPGPHRRRQGIPPQWTEPTSSEPPSTAAAPCRRCPSPSFYLH
jgi:hypothetical protein